jgi:two-component system, NtrC family, sensor histidine kinase HydH
MARYLSHTVTMALITLLLIVSAGMIYLTIENVSTLDLLSVQSLENTALALATTAENNLRLSGSHKTMAQIFSDRVVAYAFITNDTGRILFHTNPSLIGSSLSPSTFITAGRDRTTGRRITLGTGTPAYEFRHIIHEKGGAEEVLWLVLYTAQIDRTVANAKRMWWSVAILLPAMWIAGFLFRRLLFRYLKTQKELEQKSRLAMVGQMTAVLAHEIRNALGGVKGYVQWMDEKATDPDAVHEGAAIVVKGAERIEKLVSDLLLFSKDEVYNITDFDIRSLIKETVPLALSGWQGTIVTELGEFEMRVEADSGKVQQVLINVLQNSLQAMGNDGTLSVSLGSQGGFVRLKVVDSGPGVADDDLPKLFTPFFTTKANGTGLGLVYTKKVIEAMGGAISLENGAAQGTVFTITLNKAKE